MRVDVSRSVSAAGAMLLAIASLVSFSFARADDSHRTLEERKVDRGEALREKARSRASQNLGYETVAPPVSVPGSTGDRQLDFFTIGQQIARLGAALQAMAVPQALPGVLPGPGPEHGDVKATYGPDGPTVRAVRLILDYRIMVTGNPRLKVGKVEDGKERIRAQVVTIDDSLVEEYLVDKATGTWIPVR